MPDDNTEPLDELIAHEAKGYRAGGADPSAADRMWARIQGDVADAIQPRRRTRRWTQPWLVAGAGIAAALVIGVAIGRRSQKNDVAAHPSTVPESRALVASVDSARSALMRALTLSHLVQAEMFLTEVRADLRTGRRDPQRGERSRHLLARTRLIMADDAEQAAPVERLLQDLELVLAGIAALPDTGSGRPLDARLLDEQLRVGTVLPRIRTLLPSSPEAGGGL